MADPIALRRPPAGARYDEQAVDGTRGALGDLLTNVDDGSGGRRAGWTSADDVTGGVRSGTPGNLVLPFIVEAGEDSPIVLGGLPSSVTRIPAGRIRANLTKVAALTGQVDVVVAGSAGSYLDVGYSLNNGLTIAGTIALTLLIDTVGHHVAIATVPTEAQTDVLLIPMAGGGDGAASPEIWNFLALATSATPPAPVPPTIADYSALFLSHVGTYSDTARTTEVTDDGSLVAGWENQITGAIAHGEQATSGSRPTVSTSVLLNGFRTLRFTGKYMLFPNLLDSITEATFFVVVRVDAEVGYGLWNMGGGGAGTKYPNAFTHEIQDIAGSTVLHTTVDPTPDLTGWHVYAVRAKNGEWANYLDAVQLYSTATNTVAFDTGSPRLGLNWTLEGINGDFAAFALVDEWLDDDAIEAKSLELMGFYNLTPP